VTVEFLKEVVSEVVGMDVAEVVEMEVAKVAVVYLIIPPTHTRKAKS